MVDSTKYRALFVSSKLILVIIKYNYYYCMYIIILSHRPTLQDAKAIIENIRQRRLCKYIGDSSLKVVYHTKTMLIVRDLKSCIQDEIDDRIKDIQHKHGGIKLFWEVMDYMLITSFFSIWTSFYSQPSSLGEWVIKILLNITIFTRRKLTLHHFVIR